MIRNRTLKSRLIATQLLVAMGVLVLCSLAYITNDVLLLDRNLNENAQTIGKLLSAQLEPTLSFQDRTEAGRILQSLRSMPAVEGAKVVLPDGDLFASYGATENDMWDRMISFPIERDHEELGTITLQIETKVLRHELMRYAAIVVTILIFGLLISLSFALYTQRLFTQPIQNLLAAVLKITKSGDYSVQVPHTSGRVSTEEFMALTASFNDMIHQIYDAKNGLERKVEERTAEIRKMQEGLVQSSRMSAIGEMAGGIAHEINNPLQIIYGKALMLRRKVEKGPVAPEVLTADADQIAKTAMRIAKIISGLRSFSRDGKKDPFERTSLSVILNDTLELCSAKIRNHGIELRLHPIPSNVELYCRATEVGQVLLNLLNNSYDAVEKLAERWIAVDYRDHTDSVELVVTDSGAGIPDTLRQKIMQPFFTTKEVGKGTGLGLSISRGIAEAHRGNLTIDTHCANTRFILTLAKDPRQLVPKSTPVAA